MKTLLILHGWGSCAKNWSRVKELLENQGYKIYLPDLPGFGQNSSLLKPWSLDDYVEWVKEYSEKQNLSQFFLLGHSFGGRVAIKFAIKYPKKLLGLILVSAGGAESSETLKNLEKRVLKSFSSLMKKFCFLPGYQFFRKFFYKFVIRKTDYLKAKGTLKETFKKVIQENLIPYLNEIKTDTLIIWGKKDKLLPVREGILMHRKIANSKIEILENIHHNPHLEEPEILVQKILNSINYRVPR